MGIEKSRRRCLLVVLAAIVAVVTPVHGDLTNETASVVEQSESAAPGIVGLYPCTVTVGGVAFDLSPLGQGPDVQGKAQDSYQYSMNMCGTVGGVCAGKPGTPMVCQGNGGLFESVLAYSGPEKTPPPAWDPISAGNPAGGPKVTYKNGDYCWASPTKTRELVINLPCDESADIRPSSFTILESPPCTFTINYPNKASCGKSGGGGMSGGSAFLIIVFVCGTVYIVGGCFYKRKRMGTVGWKESIPNIDFWMSIPGLVKDGIIFTRAKITGKAPVARHSYDAL